MVAPNSPNPSHPSSSELADLLCSVGEQDEEAFDELYRRCSHRVYGLVRKVIVDAGMSADTTQEVFLALWQGGTARYDSNKGTAMSWILTIAHRKAVDKVRLEQAHRVRALQWGITHQDVDYDHVSETVLARDEATTVTACLDDLSALQREAIHLAFYIGLSYSDVAEYLGIPTATAKTRIRDGIKRLSTCLNADSRIAR
ncbi:RNA polymerase sigma-70 factor (ECF subfamily) [Arthrobacter sp. CAN_A214]|uniref:ECF RNA polymerase sigma factor SigK n=1 Tax=Arthrobacter sp. CAN_A214 TaxID=2787720 RepID=UPI001A345689